MKRIALLLITTATFGCVSPQKSDQELMPEVFSAAHAGDLEAIHTLCASYHYGIDLEKNESKAFEWCEKSALAGVNSGQTLFAEMHYRGLNTEVNLEEAYKWYGKAAFQQHPHAMYMLYIFHRDGLGVEKNAEIANKALVIAESLGSESAKKTACYQ